MINLPGNRSRSSVYAILAGLATAVVVGCTVTYVDVGPMGLSRILLLLLGALLLVPFFIALSWKRRVNLFEPIFIVVFGYGLFMFVRPLYILTFNDYEFMRFLGASEAYIPQTLAFSVLGIIALYIGYYSSVGLAAARRLPVWEGSVSPTRLRNLGVVVLVLGSLLYATFLVGTAGGSKESTALTGSAYFYLGVNVASVGILLLGYWVMLAPRWRRILLLFTLLVVFIVVATYTGKRYHLLYLGLSLVSSFYLLRGRPFSFRSLLIFLPPAFLYVIGVGAVRGGGTTVSLEDAATFEATSAAQRFFASADLGTFDTFTRILTVMPESLPFLMPGRTLLYLFVAFVPSALWPGKPLTTELLVNQEVIGNIGAVAGGAAYTYSLPGGFYVEGGITMVLIGMFIFGIFCRTIWSYYRLHGHLLSLAVLAVSMPFILLALRGYNTNVLLWYLTYLLPTILVFYYARRDVGSRRGI